MKAGKIKTTQRCTFQQNSQVNTFLHSFRNLTEAMYVTTEIGIAAAITATVLRVKDKVN